MRAVFINEFGGTENLAVMEIPVPPSPEKREVRVRVRAAGLNRADILQRMGRYPAPKGYPERVPGLEFSGEIESLGVAVDGYSVGDRVMGIIPGGAQVDLLNIDASLLSRIPDRLSFEEAAAIPEAFTTAFDAVILQAHLQKGESLLIHAVASGVGLAAVQIARKIGAHIYGTSRSEEKLARADEFGLAGSIVVDSSGSFAGRLKPVVEGIDVILDLVGAKYLMDDIDILNEKGRLMLVGLTGGTRAELDLSVVLRKRLSIIGTVLRSRSLSEREVLTASFNREILPLFEKNELRPVLDRVYPVEEVREAHTRIENNENFGKVVLTF
jgi:NADPH2:quinone reductase